MDTDERDKLVQRVGVMEERRAQSDRFAWAVPAIVVASQAFLITIALDEGASPARRLIASFAALVTLAGGLHLFWKQMFAFALYEAVIKRERDALGLPRVDRDSLLIDADTLEERFQHMWLERDTEGKLVRGSTGDKHYLPRRTIRWKATRVWLTLFLMLALVDFCLAGWAVYDWVELDWFGSDQERFRFDHD